MKYLTYVLCVLALTFVACLGPPPTDASMDALAVETTPPDVQIAPETGTDAAMDAVVDASAADVTSDG